MSPNDTRLAGISSVVKHDAFIVCHSLPPPAQTSQGARLKPPVIVAIDSRLRAF